MDKYNISLGAILEQDGLQRIRAQINKLELDPINIKLDMSQVQTQINSIRTQLQSLGNVPINIGAGAGGNMATGAMSGATKAKQAVNELTTAFNKLKNISRNIGSINIKLNGLDASKDINQIKVLEGQLKSLTTQYHNTVAKIKSKGDLSSTQWQSIQQQIDNTKIKLEQLSGKISDTKARLASGIQANFGNYEAQIVSLEGKFNRLAAQPQEVRVGIDSLKQALATLKSADGTDAIIAANENYKRVLREVNAQINANIVAEQQSNSNIALQQGKQQALLRLHGLFENNSQAAKRFGVRVQELDRQIKACGTQTGLTQLQREISILGKEVQMAGVQTQTFGSRLKAQLSQYSVYFSGYMLFMYAFQALSDMFEQVKAIDSAMTELKKVTNETDETYSKFLSNAATKSKEIGTTISGLVDSTADFARLGYNFKDAQGLAEVANIYAVVGDEVEGVEGATKSLISTMAAFKDEAREMSNEDFALSIVDKFNEIGNNFAISSGGIGEALKRSASSLDAANNTIDESIALITAANTVVQDPEKVGTAFKTISMRIRGKFVPIYNENYSLCYAV